MISVIIPTYNASTNLSDLLEKIKVQSIPDIEIIVIDSSSEDDTIKIAKDFEVRTIVIPKKEFNHGGTRTLAGKEARGDILVYMTQDALPVDNLVIEHLIRPFSIDDQIGAAFGRQLPNPDASPCAEFLRVYNYPEVSYVRSLDDRKKYGIRTIFISNSFAAYQRKALEAVDWFKGDVVMGEDTCVLGQMMLRGYKAAYISEARVFHSHNYSLTEEFRRYFDTGLFHKREEWILREFGKAEGEGGRYIRSGFAYLLSRKHYFSIPLFLFRGGIDFIGYKLGRNCDILPKKMISRLSMHLN